MYEDPDEIRIINEATGKTVESLTVNEGGMINYSLEAGAYVNGIRLEAYPSLFGWELSDSLGTVDEDGNVSLKDDGSENATLRVRVGSTVKEIPIIVTEVDTFADISGHWAHDVIEDMADSGIINGIERNKTMLFMPDSNITRIQFAAIIAKALDIDIDKYSNTPLTFTDKDKIQPWAVGYIKAMAALGYMNGRSDDNGKTVYLDPESSITRAEAFTMIARSLKKYTMAELGYSDAADIPEWARTSFAILAAEGIIHGFGDNTIKPNGYTTRAEAAVLINKAFN